MHTRVSRDRLDAQFAFYAARDQVSETLLHRRRADVAQQHPEQLLRLRRRYDAFAQGLRQRRRSSPTSTEVSPEIDPETAERLRSLGYLGE